MSVVGAAAAVAGVVAAWWWPATGLVTAVVVAAGPPRLGLRGRTSPLAWTRRLRTLAAVWVALVAVAVGRHGAPAWDRSVAAAAALAVPVLVDLGLRPDRRPFERAAGPEATSAGPRERLRRVAPTVVAITGSYGKTGTKGYVAHLVAGSKTVVASPASFNNRAGLARAVNENLVEGTEVFVAEMGTYGRGRDRRALLLARPRHRRDHRRRARPPGAVRIGGPDRRGQGRDPGGGRECRSERRRPSAGRPGRHRSRTRADGSAGSRGRRRAPTSASVTTAAA